MFLGVVISQGDMIFIHIIASLSHCRVAGNAAYIIGTIAESAAGRDRVISLTESRHIEKKNILPDLVNLLSSSDDESVMNAAGTIGTLAESDEVRTSL